MKKLIIIPIFLLSFSNSYSKPELKNTVWNNRSGIGKTISLSVATFSLIKTLDIIFKDFRVLSWKDSKWGSKNGGSIINYNIGYDKLGHYLRGFGFVSILDNLRQGYIFGKDNLWYKRKILLLNFVFSLIYEIKDGFIDWETYGYLGGEGWGIKDFLIDNIGGLSAKWFWALDGDKKLMILPIATGAFFSLTWEFN